MDRLAGRESCGHRAAGCPIGLHLPDAGRSTDDGVEGVGDKLRALLMGKVSDAAPAALRRVIAAFEQALAAQSRPGALEA